MGARKSWRFASALSEVFLEVNPREDSGSLSITRAVKYSADGVFHGTGFGKQQLSFSGAIYTQAQYNTMMSFFNSSAPFVVDDDLGRSFDSCVVSSFSFERAPSFQSPWKHSYSFSAYYLPDLVTGL